MSENEMVPLRVLIAQRVEKRREWERFRRENPEAAATMEAAREAERLREAKQERDFYLTEQQAATVKHLVRCGAGVTDAELVAGELRPTLALQSAQAFMRGDRTFLFLCGPTRIGKTVASAWCMSQIRMRFEHPRLGPVWCWPTTIPSMARCELAPMLAQQSGFGHEALETRRKLSRFNLLVIDELGAESHTETWQARLEDILNLRFRDRLRTVLVSNLTRAMFRKRYGDRIWGRIKESGMSPQLMENEKDGA